MESINLNHTQLLFTSVKTAPSQNTTKAPEDIVFTANTNSSPSVKVTLSPEASQISHDYKSTSRFASMEEQSENKTRVVSTWVTLEELESGSRRPFATAEDERLSRLTLKELMEESLKLPNVDKNEHLQSGFAGTEQGDRIGVAIANILLEAQYDYLKAAKDVESSVKEFKKYVEEELGIDPDSYDIVFRNGKVTAVSKGKEGASDADLEKIQDILDDPEKIKEARKLVLDIESFNTASLQLVENQLTQYIHGPQQNRYLPKEVSIDFLMEETNYSNVSGSSQLNSKYLSIMQGANEKYHAALKDGSHLKSGTTDPGILELTRMRQS
jgi:hypothetical protein